MPAPNITPLPTPPSRSQSPETFSTDADTFLGALPDFATDANAQASYLDGLAAAVDADAIAAAASEAAAAASEAAAALSETNAAASEAAAAASETAAALSETNAATSEVNAAASETAAAASAAEAEAIVAGIGFQDVVFINSSMSPYSITSATNGKLIACDTSGGNIVIDLPQISGLTLPFTSGAKKTTSDVNSVTINCSGSDTFDDGTTSKTLVVPSGFTLLPDVDPSPDKWTAIGFGGANAGPVTSSGLVMSSDKILGRTTAGTGAIEELTKPAGDLVGTSASQVLTNKTIDAYKSSVVAVAASDVDCSAGNFFTKTASGALTWTVSNVPASGAFTFLLELTNGGTGTQTWMSGIKWPGGTAPILTTAGVDVLGFITDDGGTTWRGVQLMKDSK